MISSEFVGTLHTFVMHVMHDNMISCYHVICYHIFINFMPFILKSKYASFKASFV